MLPELSREEILRYSCHLLIPEVGLGQGQRKLKGSSALIVGTGGLGSPVSLYLAAAGIGRIGLVDYDVVDTSNLQRQVIHGTSTVGMLKVERARTKLLDLNPDIQVEVYNEPYTSENALNPCYLRDPQRVSHPAPSAPPPASPGGAGSGR